MRLFVCFFFLFARAGHARTVSDTKEILSTMLFSAACLVITILGFVIFKRLGGRKKGDDISGSTGLDLMEMRKKGLLTPDELKKVSQSIARQMAQKDAAQNRSAVRVTSESLLLDPEVRRLQELAEVAKNASVGEESISKGTTESAPEPQSVTPEKPVPSSVSSTDEIILPPDVQQLADAGILTPEEIETVKQRLRDRQT